MKKISTNKLAKGPGTVRQNVSVLMQPARSMARKKAILTIAKTRNVSRADAQFIQARRIAQSQARKK